jgi:hypothetical protein
MLDADLGVTEIKALEDRRYRANGIIVWVVLSWIVRTDSLVRCRGADR